MANVTMLNLKLRKVLLRDFQCFDLFGLKLEQVDVSRNILASVAKFI